MLLTLASPVEDLRQEFAHLAATRDADDVCGPPRLWTVLEDWALLALSGDAELTGDALGRRVEALQDAPDAEARLLRATSVRLSADAFAVALNYDARGVVDVLARDPGGRWRVAWRLTGLAEAARASPRELGRWTWCLRGFHDGSLTGRLLEAPRSGTGPPRFLVWAHANPMMGGDWPTQLTLWSWDGRAARLEHLGSAVFAVDYEWDLRRVGPRLEVHTKEPMKSFSPCGMCGELEAVWRLELTPEGLRDLGREPLTPELALADALIDRVRRGQGRRGALERDLELLLRARESPKGSLGSPTWSLSRVNDTTVVLHLAAEALAPVDFTIETCQGVRTVTGVTRPPARE